MMKNMLASLVFTLSFLVCLSSVKAEMLLDFTFLPVDEEFHLPIQQAYGVWSEHFAGD